MSHAAIAAVCGDPGGAAAVAPVVETLLEEGRVPLRVFGYRQAVQVWAQRRIPFAALDEELTTPAIMELLCKMQTSLVLTGTSLNPVMLEQRFIEAARRIPVPSIAVLDSWLNYNERFGSPGGEERVLPNRIAIMDERARDEMLAEGFGATRLIITGQPAFDSIAASLEHFTECTRREVRGRWGVEDSTRVVLFASQPLSMLYGTDPTNPAYLGFHEHIVLAQLVSALEAIAADSGLSVCLVVRPHPREDRRWLDGLSSASVRIVVSSDGNPRDVVLSADLVTGMNSLLLMEACYLQCVTVSLQPGLRRADVLPTNSTGQSRAVYQLSDVRSVVEQLLLDDPRREALRARLKAFAPLPGAARRVADLVYHMLGDHQPQS